MKKFVTALSLSTLAMFATQGAYANNAEKIAVVKKFLYCNLNDVECTGDNGTNVTKRFLSKSAITVLDYERQTTERDLECSAVVPRCYSGLWTIPGVDYDKHLAKRTMKISVAQNGVVVAKFQVVKGSPVTAYFKVVKENGQYKIDNSAYDDGDWWR